MHIFNFRCKACDKVLKHHAHKQPNGDVIEDELCHQCRRIALESLHSTEYFYKLRDKELDDDF